MVHRILQYQTVYDTFRQTKQSVYTKEFFLWLRMGERDRSTHVVVSGLDRVAEIGEPLHVPSHHPVNFFMIPNVLATCPSTTAAIRFDLNGDPYTQCDFCYRTWPTKVVSSEEQEGLPES